MLVSATWQHRSWARVLSRSLRRQRGGPRIGARNGVRAERRGHWFGWHTGHHAAHDHLIDHPVHLRASARRRGSSGKGCRQPHHPPAPRPPPHLLDVEDDVQLADVLKVAVERLDEHLRPHRTPPGRRRPRDTGRRRPHRRGTAAKARGGSGGGPEARTCMRSRMPSSLSLASMAKMKKSVAYCRYTMRAPGSNHLDASRKLHTPVGHVLSGATEGGGATCTRKARIVCRRTHNATLRAHLSRARGRGPSWRPSDVDVQRVQQPAAARDGPRAVAVHRAQRGRERGHVPRRLRAAR